MSMKNLVAERDLNKNPYSKDEARVVDFLCEAGVGGGDDPIGFLLASHACAMHELTSYKLMMKYESCLSGYHPQELDHVDLRR